MIDTHAHLMVPEFKEDYGKVVERAKEAGLTAIINVGCGVDFSRLSVTMADGKFLFATVGLQPDDALDLNEELMEEWRKLIDADKKWADRKIVAIGETGLDYVRSEIDPEKQKKSFERHLRLADEVGLPVIVHNRGADEDCLKLLGEFPDVKAVFHCFGASLEFARKVWDAGYMTSFTGIITFPSAGNLREVVKEASLDRIMVETDCPYLAPQKYRGKRNEPAFVAEVVRCIADEKKMDFENIAEISRKNSVRFFEI